MCKKDSCDEVYIGQSHNIHKRLGDHMAAKHRDSMSHYTSRKHTNVQRGHELMPANSLVPYKSNSLSHRLIIETCLISVSNTVYGNKTSSCNIDMTTLAPIILQASPVDWNIISEVQPNLNPAVVPRRYKSFFSNSLRPSIDSTNIVLPSGNAISNSPGVPTHSYHLRSRGLPPET